MGLLSGALSLAGSYLGYKSAKASNKLSKRAYYYGIRDRVADAEAAGVHKLYAIGAGAASPGAISIDGAGSGAGVLRTAAKLAREREGAKKRGATEEQAIRESKARVLRQEAAAKFDEIRAAKVASDMARINQRGNVVQDIVQSKMLTGPGGGKFKTSKSSTAQTVEDEYSDIIGNIYGIYRGAMDYRSNRATESKKAREQYKRDREKYGRKQYRR